MTWVLDREPPLALENIQAHSMIGFGAALQAIGAFTSTDFQATANVAARWAAIGRVTTAADIYERKGGPALSFMSRAPLKNRAAGPWVAIALSHRLLRSIGAPSAFDDECFEAEGGMSAIGGLNDPRPSTGTKGSDWVVGGPGAPVDVLVVAASGTTGAALEVVGMFHRELGASVEAAHIEPLLPIEGAREHFGFRDGISQPAMFGTCNGQPFENERGPRSSPRPATTRHDDLIWPGEFFFGYPSSSAVGAKFAGPVRRPSDPATSEFATDGSFLVYRRMSQDVVGFRSFLETTAERLTAVGKPMSAERLGALAVGRERDGRPVALDKKGHASLNRFTFVHDAMSVGCPLSAHIRKVNPRAGGDFEIVPRILRRGAPFGPPIGQSPGQDAKERGLAFLGYQSSIDRQFRRIMADWVNDSASPNRGGGFDPIIGQPPDSRPRFLDLPELGPSGRLDLGLLRWVSTTGGAFLFAPSIKALRSLHRG